MPLDALDKPDGRIRSLLLRCKDDLANKLSIMIGGLTVREKAKLIWAVCNIWRTGGGYLLLLAHGKEYKNRVLSECRYWYECMNVKDYANDFIAWSWLLIHRKEYRNLAEYRLATSGINKVLAKIALVLLPRLSSLYLWAGEIGWNLFIQHGFSTVIAAQSLGRNCWVNQQVTVGHSFADKPPVVGNGVRITAGAKVIGDIKLGDNVIVGANAVVTKDVEDNLIVAGVPSKTIGVNERHRLYC